MTTANKITILRILLVPFFVVEVLYYVKDGEELHRLLAILSFAVAAICDGVDGYIARRYNQRSELGAILDPLADKLLLVSGIVVLSFDQRPYLETVPLWLTGTIIGRDVLLLIGLVVIQLKLKEGDKAPEFTALTNGGGEVSLSDFKGKSVILYFYPRDNTPGCTKEACAFRDEFAAFKKKGAVVLGVSTDSAKSHDKFVEKQKLPFTLLADEDKKIVNAYGVWGEKHFMGMKFMGTNRVTFLIGSDGRIKKIWPKVKPAQHAEEVLASL